MRLTQMFQAIALILLLLLGENAALAIGVQNPGPTINGRIFVGGPTCPGSDSFSGTGALSGCWTTGSGTSNWATQIGGSTGTATQSSGYMVNGGAFSTAAAAYTGGTTPTNAAAEITVSAFATPANIYLCIHGSTSGTGYCWNANGGSLQKYNGSGAGFLANGCPALVVGHTYKMDWDAGTITLSDLAGGTPCTAPDSTYASGVPVVIIDYSSGGSGVQLSLFQTVTP